MNNKHWCVGEDCPICSKPINTTPLPTLADYGYEDCKDCEIAECRGIQKCIEALRSKEGQKVFYDGGHEWGLHVSDWLEHKFLKDGAPKL